MKTTVIVLVSIFLFAFSCEGDKKENNSSMETELSQVIEENVLIAEDFKGKLDELLTLEMAAETSGYPVSEAKKSPNSEIEKKSNKISVSYFWDKTNRTQQIEMMGRKMDVPVNDEVTLSWVENITLDGFKKKYHNLTEAEIEASNQGIDEKTAEMNADGKATQEQTDMAKSLAKNAMKNFSVEEVPNVGEYAVFVNQKFAGVPTRELKVFYKGLSFSLLINLSEDVSFNDKKAIALAQKIINQKLK
ncbi:hypothetical protein [Flavobacterium lacus]|uniref:Lipoprotein n=1 Tax=Flavobacterium lacus TaxID=1353778 RepID=A0A328X528_9FLAO|nr:hypothetical protein [Flavobacterium lacus]RAR50448.1 hypothetical protein B0I10_102252 [Flavobacterium lacus]